MIERNKVLAIIPARGGSKGIPGKNHRTILGKPLISWTIEHALNIDIIDDIVVTTDDKKIKNISTGYDVKIVDRPKSLAEDNSIVVDAVRHVLEAIQKKDNHYDIFIMMEPTALYRRESDTISIIKMVSKKNSVFDCAATFRNALLHPERAWAINSKQASTFLKDSAVWRNTNRQSLSRVYQLLGTYVFRESALGENIVLSGNVGAIIVPEKYCIDLDDEYDLLRAEIILKDLIKSE